MRIHCNASTNRRQRSAIQTSTLSSRAIARELKVAPSTVHRWRSRDHTEDLSSRPARLRQAMSPDCRVAALALRSQRLTLDECLEALIEQFPGLKRSTLHRFFQSQGVGRLPPLNPKEVKSFKVYTPGFVHMDHLYLPALGAVKRYCFIAIDRATRLAFLRVYDDKTAKSASDFFEKALAFFPFKVHRLLTDNGPEFSNKRYRRAKCGALKKHPIEVVCMREGISHRLTAPYTPATNGMAERFVGLCKQATVNTKRYASHQALEQELQLWMKYYNLLRKHGSIKRETPIDNAQTMYKENPELFKCEPRNAIEAFLT